MHFQRLATFILSAAILASLPILSGCAARSSGNDYTANETHQAYAVYYAEVTSVRQVNINSNSEGRQLAGGTIGAVTGGVIGSTIGHREGRTLATLGGALIGGAVGAGVGNMTAHQTGQEICVRYEDGKEEAIVQEGEDPSIYVGQRVRVLVASDGSCRVLPE